MESGEGSIELPLDYETNMDFLLRYESDVVSFHNPMFSWISPAGKVQTFKGLAKGIQKFLKGNWSKATFGNVEKTVEYHMRRHGQGQDVVKFTKNKA